MPSKVWAVRTGLLSTFGEAMPSGVDVRDSPYIESQTPQRRFLIVGGTGGDTATEDTESAMAFRQEWAAVSGNQRHEVGEVTCAAWAWSGSASFTQLRSDVQEILDVVETALRADKRIGDVLAPTGSSEITDVAIAELHRPSAFAVRAAFTVAYQVRLT